MLPRARLGAVCLPGLTDGYTENCVSQIDIPALNELALRSLASLLDEKEGLFSRRLVLTNDGLRRDRVSWKHTIIALLGLQRVAELSEAQPFDIASIRGAILGNTNWVESLGDLGLLIWFTAECAPERLGKLLADFQIDTALDAFSDGRQARTRSVAWFLAGIARAQIACPGTCPDLTDVAVEAFHLLQDNQSESGIYGHAAFPRFAWNIYWRRFGTFSDQVFAIYALTTFAWAFAIEEPLGPALSCANSICSLQGDRGEWWSLYDKRSCHVVSRYPVFSLHQDGTAPLALLALGKATGQKYHESISKGLSWVAGMNELGDDLRNLDQGLIWDSMESTGKGASYWEAALSFFNLSRERMPSTLKIRCEVRPDHFGWLLYALGNFGLPTSTMAVKTATAG